MSGTTGDLDVYHSTEDGFRERFQTLAARCMALGSQIWSNRHGRGLRLLANLPSYPGF